jgi:hypothetical protein
VVEVSGTTIPGFTPEQSWVIRQVAREAAREAVNEFSKRECTLSCPRMDNVEATVFGSSERSLVGLDDRVRQLERFEARVARLTWLVVGQIVVLLGVIVTVISIG